MSKTRAEKRDAIFSFIKGGAAELTGFPVEWWISHRFAGDDSNWDKAQKIMSDWWKVYGKKR